MRLVGGPELLRSGSSVGPYSPESVEGVFYEVRPKGLRRSPCTKGPKPVGIRPYTAPA
jgi:hypothetical protein